MTTAQIEEGLRLCREAAANPRYAEASAVFHAKKHYAEALAELQALRRAGSGDGQAALGSPAPDAAAIRAAALREAAALCRLHESLHCTDAQFEDADENGVHSQCMKALSKAAREIEALAAQEVGDA